MLGLSLNANGRTVKTTSLEHYDTILQRVQGVILTHAYVLTGIVLGATLTNDNVACDALLSTENLNT